MQFAYEFIWLSDHRLGLHTSGGGPQGEPNCHDSSTLGDDDDDADDMRVMRLVRVLSVMMVMLVMLVMLMSVMAMLMFMKVMQ